MHFLSNAVHYCLLETVLAGDLFQNLGTRECGMLARVLDQEKLTKFLLTPKVQWVPVPWLDLPRKVLVKLIWAEKGGSSFELSYSKEQGINRIIT